MLYTCVIYRIHGIYPRHGIYPENGLYLIHGLYSMYDFYPIYITLYIFFFTLYILPYIYFYPWYKFNNSIIIIIIFNISNNLTLTIFLPRT